MMRLLMSLCLLCPAVSYQHYQQKLPNADRVPDPANANYLWPGVGHLNANGGGTRNVFGEDFKANNFIWDETLCKKDSDSDGRSNGDELGDPDCTWVPGSAPSTNTGLTHPGICEPLTKPECEEVNENILFRSAEPFDCPATKQADVRKTIYRFPETEVPGRVTNYFCMYFPLDIPEGTSEHLIAYEPIIDNAEVMHHTIAYGCRADQSATMSNRSTGRPESCGEGMSICQEPVFLWTVGINGQCHPENLGGLIGAGGFTGIWLEHHWNNPLKKTGMSDSSGMIFYHTPNKRTSNAAYTIWGAFTLELPPGKENILQTGGCPAECTNKFNEETVYISQIVPHMHYLGRAMTVTLNNELVLEDRTYSYDDPKIYNFDPPLAVKRGDHMDVNCTFTTTSANDFTFNGAGTYDEMCYAISLMYPFDGSVPATCAEADGYGYCEGVKGDMGDCDFIKFWADTNWLALYTILAGKCDPDGMECWDECPDALKQVGDMAPCLAGKISRLMRGFIEFGDDSSKALAKYLISCQEVTYDTKMMEDDDDDNGDGDDSNENNNSNDVDDDDNDANDNDKNGKDCDGVKCAVASSIRVSAGAMTLAFTSAVLQLC